MFTIYELVKNVWWYVRLDAPLFAQELTVRFGSEIFVAQIQD